MAISTAASVMGAIVLIAIVEHYFLIAVAVILVGYYQCAKFCACRSSIPEDQHTDYPGHEDRESAREIKRLGKLACPAPDTASTEPARRRQLPPVLSLRSLQVSQSTPATLGRPLTVLSQPASHSRACTLFWLDEVSSADGRHPPASATIRAYGEDGKFLKQNETFINVENRAYYLSVVNQRWLGFRLDMFGGLLTSVVLSLCCPGSEPSFAGPSWRSWASVGVTRSRRPKLDSCSRECQGVAQSCAHLIKFARYILTIQQAFSWMGKPVPAF